MTFSAQHIVATFAKEKATAEEIREQVSLYSPWKREMVLDALEAYIDKHPKSKWVGNLPMGIIDDIF